MKKPDHALLARVDARKMTEEIDRTMEDFGYFRDWRNQIEYYREQAAKLPEQRRSVPIWTPITKIGKKGRKYSEDQGAQQTEIDGVLHYATGWKETPTRTLERQIDDAEQAAEAGDIGKFGLHIGAIVQSLLNAKIPTIQQAQESARQRRNAQAPRTKLHGLLLKIITAIDAKTTAEAEQAFKAGLTLKIEGQTVTLGYEPEDDKPYTANGERWNKPVLATTVTRHKNRKA